MTSCGQEARRRIRSGLGVALVALGLAAAAACGGGGSASDEPAATSAQSQPAATESEPSSQPSETQAPAEAVAQPGGVYRIGVEASFNFSGGFDPTGEYVSTGWMIYGNLLLRTLLGYRHAPGLEGSEVLPDLAAELPEVSADGLTYTFTLKDGIRFGPPVSREITSRDVLYAFERIGTPTLIAQYGFYYTVIEGMQEFTDGKAETISGIETPDDKTIVFHLTTPTGDFPYRVAMPATAPIPEEVASCFTEAGEYGRYVIASGPYMLEGSDALDATSCETMKPISGFKPNTGMTLVRNPDYDPATDTPEMREALPDRFELEINANVDDIFAKIQRGELEGELAGVPPKVLREYTESEELADRIQINPVDATWYISLNLTQPPFDDVHVRRAVNLVMDKEGLRRVWGGSLKGEIATHVVPNPMLADELVDYDPYATPDYAGDVEAAKAEMRQSRYDSDGDGICDEPECDRVLHLTSTQKINEDMIPVIEASLAKIGITLESRQNDDVYTVIQTVSKNIPITSAPGWFKDFADASTFAVLFDSRSTIPQGNINYSLVGLAPEQAGTLDGIAGNFEGIPNVDADIDACTELTGDERVTCWADLDRKLMEDVVPWVPYLWENAADILGPAVTQYAYDQFMGEAALAHVAVDPSRQ